MVKVGERQRTKIGENLYILLKYGGICNTHNWLREMEAPEFEYTRSKWRKLAQIACDNAIASRKDSAKTVQAWSKVTSNWHQ